MHLIDTHCHIDLDSFDEDRDEMLARALKFGVTKMLVIGFEPERWRTSLELAERCRRVRVAVGVHPNSVEHFSSEALDTLAALTRRDEVVAIGETGIDLYWNKSSLDQQTHAFREQVSLARDLAMPFIVHQRDAEQEVLDVLRSFPSPLNGVLHCFTGDWSYAREALDLGLHIGLGGAVTFKSRSDLHDAVLRLPLERIVLETDAPFMAPVPHRGKRNEPAYLSLIAEEIARLRDTSAEVLASETSKNAERLFPGLGNAA